MFIGETRKISRQDVPLVQDCIERCLQRYMSKKEVMNTLLHEVKIEPCFTDLVWRKLEEENQEFFREYYKRLILKDQIVRFNALLEGQMKIQREMYLNGIASIPMSNRSHLPSLHQNHQNTTTFNGAFSSLHAQPRTTSGSSSNMQLSQNSSSNMRMVTREFSGGMAIKQEVDDYDVNPAFVFDSDNNNNTNNDNNNNIDVVYTRSTMGDTLVSSDSRYLNGALLDHPEILSPEFLGQIPESFSPSGLSFEVSNGSGVL